MPTKWGFGGGWWTFERLNIQRMFVCRACSNVLPTRDNLYRRVGKTFEHALHTNILTLGGTFKLHNFLQILRPAIKPECSTRCCCPIRSATWYAVFFFFLKWETTSIKEQEKQSPHTKLLELEEGTPPTKYNPH